MEKSIVEAEILISPVASADQKAVQSGLYLCRLSVECKTLCTLHQDQIQHHTILLLPSLSDTAVAVTLPKNAQHRGHLTFGVPETFWEME